MNRLQKKCVIATAGFHLLLLVILLVGPAFFNSKPRVDDSQVLDVIPANLIDAQLNSGVKNAQPPAPAPIVTPPQPQPIPPAPTPTLAERFEKMFKSEPPKPKPDLTPVENPKQSHLPKVNLQPVVRTVPKNSTTTKPKDDSQQQARAINAALKNLKKNLTPGIVVDVPGTGSKSSANYRDALASIYYDAWTTPGGVTSETPNAIVRITVATDGTVITARIITSSGDAKVDDSVQRALERVPSVPPLPDQLKVQQDFTISFNLETKKMSE